MTSHRQHFGAFLALMAMLIGVPQGLVVVCSGEDGHVAIEFAEAPASADEHEDGSCLASEWCGCDSPCGPCTDAPLGSDASFHQAKPRESAVSDAALSLAPTAWTQPGAALDPPQQLSAGPTVPTARPITRTIVLRI